MEKHIDAKRRLNFISGEDFYFFTYELLILLDILTTDSGKFKDHRKLSYLVPLVADESAIRILERYAGRKIANADDKERLFSTFASGELHRREIYKLLFALQKRGFLKLEKSSTAEVLDITVLREALPEGFLLNDAFLRDRQNAVAIKKQFSRLTVLTLDGFLDKIYTQYGVQVWAR